ncbi:hypothetical protein Dester_0903 [Desulfurobacterium thermolithotrophum DSM 11699]|uniref:Putative Se/S carrier protein-like domain-containing protein n=1 Tax=Desulfurobacterium thermolithotrophum (strain DSM 11699 / BSA) TaxID=868864 RepID=F0S3X1_DESTD|nr:DUF3343 domain-containing protein [Desulfurobacterium thermolithotrophum]ADY73543.1 hypothetical protein Dester_0903 [Desulfurobacterium thermolithotrophum DSM 11699]
MAENKKLSFIATGIRLHMKECFLRFSGLFKRYDYCIAFYSIPEGLKAEKYLKGFKAVSIPLPNEIYKGWGVGILVKEEDKDRLLEHLKENGVSISGLFKRVGTRFEEVR